jgi:hypothetical protein
MIRERAVMQLIRVGNNLNQIAKQLNSQRGTLSSSNLESTRVALNTMLKRIEELWTRR